MCVFFLHMIESNDLLFFLYKNPKGLRNLMYKPPYVLHFGTWSKTRLFNKTYTSQWPMHLAALLLMANKHPPCAFFHDRAQTGFLLNDTSSIFMSYCK